MKKPERRHYVCCNDGCLEEQTCYACYDGDLWRYIDLLEKQLKCPHVFEDDGDNLQVVCTKCDLKIDVTAHMCGNIIEKDLSDD